MKEDWIVTVDGLYADFELIHWCKTKEEAEIIYAEAYLEFEYPDKEGRHLRMFQLVKSSNTSEKRSPE